jgi:hypothetical protein
MDIPLKQFLDWAETIEIINTKCQAFLSVSNCFKSTSPQKRFLCYFLRDHFISLKSYLEELAYDFHYETIKRPSRIANWPFNASPPQQIFQFGKPKPNNTGDVNEWNEYWKHRTKIFEQNTKRRHANILLDATDKYHLKSLLRNILEVVSDVRAKVEELPRGTTIISPVGSRLGGFCVHVTSIIKYSASLERDINNLKASNGIW